MSQDYGTVADRYDGDSREAESGLKDSGHRVVLPNGVIRERQPGKGRFDLVSPVATRKLAQLLEAGAIKYEERNWEMGMPLSWYVDSAQRHLGQLLEGETDEEHAVHALWNVHCLVHTIEMIRRGVLPRELDDLPDFTAPPENRMPAQQGKRRREEPPRLDLDLAYLHADPDRYCRSLDGGETWRIVREGAFAGPGDYGPCTLRHENTNDKGDPRK